MFASLHKLCPHLQDLKKTLLLVPLYNFKVASGIPPAIKIAWREYVVVKELRIAQLSGRNKVILVEMAGFEPATPCLQSMCSPN